MTHKLVSDEPLTVPRIDRSPQPSPIPGYLTTAEIAARAGVYQDHIGHLIRSGDLPATRVGSIWLVKEEDWEYYEQNKSSRGAPRGPRKKKKHGRGKGLVSGS